MSTFKNVAVEDSLTIGRGGKITSGEIGSPNIPTQDNELTTKKYVDNISSHYIVDSEIDGDTIKYTYNDGVKEMYFKYTKNGFETKSGYGSLFYNGLDIPVPEFFSNITYIDIREMCSAGLHTIHLGTVSTNNIGMYVSNGVNYVTMNLTFFIHLIGN